jgi:hypothetical protein
MLPLFPSKELLRTLLFKLELELSLRAERWMALLPFFIITLVVDFLS